MRPDLNLFSARRALRWLIAGEWRAHPARFALTAAAIAIGVALGFAVHLVNGSALASFGGAVRAVNGSAELSVTAATPLGFDEMLYPRVATAAGVADASPIVRLDARIGRAAITLLGTDAIRAAVVTPSLLGMPPRGPDARNDAVFDERAVFLSREALARAGAAVGQTVAVAANGRSVPLRIAGTLPAIGDGSAIGVIDIAAAQEHFARLGRIDRIDLQLADSPRARAALTAILTPDAALTDADATTAQGDALSRAYRVNLDMLALVALLTGGFLVFSAQSLSVTRRLREFALIRTLGLPRGGIVATVALEGLVIGIVGATIGLAMGYALAAAALTWLGGDLGAGYFGGNDVTLVFQPLAAAGFFALGVSAAILGSVLPARAASRAAPAAALKNAGDVVDPRAPIPWRAALLLILGGTAAALFPAVDGLPLFGFASMALILAGGVAGVPWLARASLAPFARRAIHRVAPLLAIRHIAGAPGEAATALCGIVASTALMIAMATMVTSFRGAVDQWLGQVLTGDLYLRATGGVSFDPMNQQQMAQAAGVARIAFSRQLPLAIVPDRPPVTLIARPIVANGSDPLLVAIERASALPAGAVPIWVSEPAQRLYGWDPGDMVRLPIAPGTRFGVSGIWRDYSRQAGAIIIDVQDYQRLTGDRARDEASVTMREGWSPRAVGSDMLARVPAAVRTGIEVAEPATLRRFALELFDRSFAVTYLLEAVAIIVGLAGVAATMSAQTVARTREFGMLRHLGLAKRQIAGMLAIEGALLGAVGGIVGATLGLVLAQVLIHVINPQSFNWTMTTRVPVGTLVGVVIALASAAAITATIAGRRATAIDAVRAVREDW
jgi:putative ABC transport system permease protein